MTMNSTAFVLIPGAGLGSWIWRDVVPGLESPAVTVDFTKDKGATLADYAREVVAQVDAGSTTDQVVLVAHSLGGAIAIEAAATLADRVAGFIALSAVLPEQGRSFASALPFPQRLMIPAIVRVVGTRPPTGEIRAAYGTDLSDRTTDEIIDRFTPESKRVYLDRVAAAFPDVPRQYIELSRDKQFTLEQQRAYARAAGIDDIVTISAGHLAMLSHPAEVAHALRTSTARGICAG